MRQDVAVHALPGRHSPPTQRDRSRTPTWRFRGRVSTNVEMNDHGNNGDNGDNGNNINDMRIDMTMIRRMMTIRWTKTSGRMNAMMTSGTSGEGCGNIRVIGLPAALQNY